MKTKKPAQKPMELTLIAAHEIARAMWKLVDYLKNNNKSSVFLEELFDADTGELIIPIDNKLTLFWLRCLRAAAVLGIVSEYNMIFTIPLPSVQWLQAHSTELNQTPSKERLTELLYELYGKKVAIKDE
jgi:hypothetical protein